MKLLLADDDELITTALTTILGAEKDFEIAGTATCGEEAVRLYEACRPDVVLTDIRMPYGGDTPHPSASQTPSPQGEGFSESAPGGLEAAERILAAYPDACILLLTTFLDDEYIIRALRLGVSGYLLKQDYASLAPAIRAAYEGQNVFGAEITAKMPSLIADKAPQTGNNTSPQNADHLSSGQNASQHQTRPEALSGLTGREAELCNLIAEGLSNKEIAEVMYLSEGTVRNYLSTVLEKLQLRDRTQLAIYYLTGRR